MRLSASLLRQWITCPLQAKFARIDHLPRGAQNAKAAFGSCMHHALEHYNLTGDMDGAVAIFRDVWADPSKIGIDGDNMIWPKYITFSKLMAQGTDALKDYHERNKWEKREILGAEYRALVPFGKHELLVIVDCIEAKKSRQGVDSLYIVDYKTNGKAPYPSDLRLNIQFCADDETEILTRRGWLRHGDLIEGEDVLTLNVETRQGEWQPAESVNRFEAVDQELVSIEGRNHSSLTTRNHRWHVDHTVCGRNGWRVEPRIVTSDALTGDDMIPCAAPGAAPTEAKWDDAFVELVAWYWTEGQRMRGERTGVCIGQSNTVNPDKVERIRGCLTALLGAPSTRAYMDRTTPEWKEVPGSDVNRFYLNGLASQELRSIVAGDEKLVDYDFLTALTAAQLALFIDASLAADGSTDANGTRRITQASKQRLDRFQLACSIAGIRTSLQHKPIRGSGPYAGRSKWNLTLLERTPKFRPRKVVQERQRYTGTVWCPTTRNSTWLARRNGHVYFTGNTCYYYATTCKEFWVGNGPQYPGMPNGEALWERFQDAPRRPVWYGLLQNKPFDAGDRDDGDFARLYRVANEIERAITHEVFVPNLSGEACTFCDFTKECRLPFPMAVNSDDPAAL